MFLLQTLINLSLEPRSDLQKLILGWMSRKAHIINGEGGRGVRERYLALSPFADGEEAAAIRARQRKMPPQLPPFAKENAAVVVAVEKETLSPVHLGHGCDFVDAVLIWFNRTSVPNTLDSGSTQPNQAGAWAAPDSVTTDSRKFKTSYRGLNLFSKLNARSTGWPMIYVSSQPASFIRNVILSHKFFFERFQMAGCLLNAAMLSGWDHPKLIRVAKVASNLDLLKVMTVKSA
ncbi:hypothetical protein C4D60_Mb10t00980 [Musa balbisiana]|uniref:Uncharacterized protein n=1 Tax=Musa balbisiana TaxID=52838 RepID=A0A4S8IW93_MUSBA|nr:hypothetical protein C4D60_Mb10t00980 [Musa balbisiana]